MDIDGDGTYSHLTSQLLRYARGPPVARCERSGWTSREGSGW